MGVMHEAEARITDAGRAAIERARADGSWHTLEPVEALIVPDDLASALAEPQGASAARDGMSPTVRREYLLWIVTARREATRQKRVVTTAELVAKGRRRSER